MSSSIHESALSRVLLYSLPSGITSLDCGRVGLRQDLRIALILTTTVSLCSLILDFPWPISFDRFTPRMQSLQSYEAGSV